MGKFYISRIVSSDFICHLFFFLVIVAFSAVFNVSADVVHHESGGMVVGEAELYSSRTYYVDGGISNSWYVVPDESAGVGAITNARGGSFIQCLPDNGSRGSPINPPELMYKIQIYSPGIYRLYSRLEGNRDDNTGWSSDSIFADIVELKDGVINDDTYGSPTNQIADWYEFTMSVDRDFATSPWKYTGRAEENDAGASGHNAEWFIHDPGIYTLRYTQREDGAALDAFVFQLRFLPAPTGYGPTEPDYSRFVFQATDDTYLRRDDTNAFRYAEDKMTIKNDGGAGPSSLDRVAYLRFDISAMQTLEPGVSLTNASFNIDLSYVGLTNVHDVFVAVIDENADVEDFSETNLWPDVSDVWNDATDEAVDFNKIYGSAPIGSFEINKSLQGSTLTLSNAALMNAIKADTDGVLSLVMYRTIDDEAGDDFATKENEGYSPPHIILNYWYPETGTTLIIR